MRCTSYCTASSYNMSDLVEHLIKQGSEPKYFDDVVHVQKDIRESKSTIDIFYFPYGSTIIWGAEESQEKDILEELEAFQEQEVEEFTSDLIYFRYGKKDKTFIDEEKNEIILASDLDFIKLSISHALAQSVKLEILERSVMRLIDRTTPIQKELAVKGSVSLSKKEISKKIGELFNERYSINMHSDILDEPEFFWRRPSYEPLYLMTMEFQDIQMRQDIMNKRLDLINDLYSVLSNELNHRHSSRLEVIIIALIAIEVVLGLLDRDIWPDIAKLWVG